MPSSAISSAISRMVEVPLPLSLMPGPAMTESRWAPTTTTWSALPVGEPAMMLRVVRVGSISVSVNTCTVTGPVWSWAYRAAASAKLRPTTGMSKGRPRVPLNSSSRPGLPSLKLMTAS
jgi:hypothetical protein